MNQWSKQPSHQWLAQKANHGAFQGEEPGDRLPVSIWNSQKSMCENQRLSNLCWGDWKDSSDTVQDLGSMPSAAPHSTLTLSSPLAFPCVPPLARSHASLQLSHMIKFTAFLYPCDNQPITVRLAFGPSWSFFLTRCLATNCFFPVERVGLGATSMLRLF